METIDPKMAARVWQRVQRAKGDVHTAGGCDREKGTPEQAELPDLRELIAKLWVDAAVCRQLVRHFRGRDRAVLEGIARQKQANAASLKGIFAMQTGTRPRVPTPPIPRGNREQLLRLCCDGTVHCAAQYERLASDPHYGSDYAAMAEQARWQHRQLLGLLGK